MPTNPQTCPDSQTLIDFLLGKLPSQAIEDCRLHLVECDPCVDTIRGLKVDGDTIHDLSCEAWSAMVPSQDQNTEIRVVDELIDRIEKLPGLHNQDQDPRTGIMQDRAAEVQRLLEPPLNEQDLGRLGKYRIGQLLGAGSTGVVYQAIDEDLGRTVAIKILRPSLGGQARERFIAEARATAKLQHPNVVQIYEVGREGPLAFISMMWEPGETLEQRLEAQEDLSVDEVQTLGTHLAGALEHAHQQGLIHRDIKPANIWIPQEQGVSGCKILDFGLVRITDEDPQLTCTGMIAGTPCYMSPEQSRGQSLDCRSDLFSLGCVLYQALTGRLPFQSDNALSTLQSIQRDQPAAPVELDPSIPVDLSMLVMCMLAKSPNRRPPDAASVASALTCKRKHWPFEVPDSIPAKTNSRPRRTNPIGVVVATLFAGLGLGVFGLMYGPQITRIVTNEGVIEIDCKVDDITIEVRQNGKSIRVVDLATDQSIQVKAGAYEIRPIDNQNAVHIENSRLTMTRGGKEVVTITRSPVHSGDSIAGSSKSEVPPSGGMGEGIWPEIESSAVGTSPYLLAAGDVLGIFIEGVLGESGSSPPVHFPQPGSSLPPSMGYPVLVEHDGQLSLPLIKPISVQGKTLAAAKRQITSAFRGGEYPILKENARIMVSLMRERDMHALSFLAQPLESGDVLGVFIPGILGEFESSPPIHMPDVGSGLHPSLGFPIVVDEDGKISLPLIPSIPVRGKTISEAKQLVTVALVGGENPILKENAQIIITLMQKQGYAPPQSGLGRRERIVDAKIALEQAKMKYGPRHLLVRKLEKELEILEKNFTQNALPSSALGSDNSLGSDQSLRDARNPVLPTARATEDSSLQTMQLKEEFKNQQKLFEQDAITQDQLYRTQSRLLESQIDDTNNLPGPRQNECHDLLKKLLAVRNSQYSLAYLASLDPVRPGSESMERESDIVQNLKKARAELAEARSQLRHHEQRRNLPTSLPLYNGMTYEECLEIATSERDLSKLIPAVKGLGNLVDEHERHETTHAIMKIIQRGTPLADKNDIQAFDEFIEEYFKSLTPHQSIDLICDELADGNSKSLFYIASDMHALCYRIRKSQSHGLDFDPMGQQVVDAVGNRYAIESQAEIRHSVLDVLASFDHDFDCTNLDFSDLVEIIETAFTDAIHAGRSLFDAHPYLVAKIAPGTGEFVPQLQLALQTATEVQFQRLVAIIMTMPSERAKQLLPPTVEAWTRVDSKQFPSVAAAEYFRRYADECRQFIPLFEGRLRKIHNPKGASYTSYKELIDHVKSLPKTNNPNPNQSGPVESTESDQDAN